MKQRAKSKYKEYTFMLNEDDDFAEASLPLATVVPKIETMEKKVEEGDTLQSIAIQFRCTIEELKRLNNIHKENEIYAHQKIRVPFRASEPLIGVHQSGSTTPNLLPEDAQEPSNSDLNQVIFNSTVTHKPAVEPNENEEGEKVCLLPATPDAMDHHPVASMLYCNGADCDVSIPALICCVLLLCVVLPLIYIFYIAEHPEEFHHDHNSKR